MIGSMDNAGNRPDQWLREHGDALYRFALSRLHDKEAAADLVQETMLAAWRGRDSFAGNASIRTWLIGILKHKIIDHIRKEIRGRELSESLEGDPTSAWFADNGAWARPPTAWKDDPEALCKSEQFNQTLEACLAKLPEKQHQVFRMREIIGEDTDTICKACDISATHLHVLIHRARMALRACLEFNWFGGSRNA